MVLGCHLPTQLKINGDRVSFYFTEYANETGSVTEQVGADPSSPVYWEMDPSLLGRVTELLSVVSFPVLYCCMLLSAIMTSKLHCILGEELCLLVYLMQQCKCSDKTIFRPACLGGVV